MGTTARARIDIRLTAKHKRLIDNAARAVGVSVSQFVTTKAVAAAEQTLEAQQLRTLSASDQRAFLRMLDHTTPNAALKKAAAKFTRRHGR